MFIVAGENGVLAASCSLTILLAVNVNSKGKIGGCQGDSSVDLYQILVGPSECERRRQTVVP
jgi:hypothetical protein